MRLSLCFTTLCKNWRIQDAPSPQLIFCRWVISLLQGAEIIMEDLWCNPLTYFNNVASFPFFVYLMFSLVQNLSALCATKYCYLQIIHFIK